jgi:carbamoyl-phosphate synthase large subunit
MGGQLRITSLCSCTAGVKVLGTHPENIDRAEDRNKFSALLDELGIDQPRWFHVTDVTEAHRIVERLGVSGTRSTQLCPERCRHECGPRKNELLRILERAKSVSREHPVVVSKFEVHA